MKLQLLIFTACLCAASAGIPKKIFKKYMMTKMMESCFGEQTLSDMSKEMAAASIKCRAKAGPMLPQVKEMVHFYLAIKGLKGLRKEFTKKT